MKYSLKISGTAKFGLVIVAGCCFIYLMLNFSPWARAARQNVSNSEKVKIGMPQDEVLSIMGKPDRTESLRQYVDLNHHGVRRHTGLKRYYYRPPAFAGDGIYIWLDTTDTVVYITHVEL